MALFAAFLFLLLACAAYAGSCAKKSCGDVFEVTSWNPERVYETIGGKRVSRDIYYYEVTTNGCGAEFTDILLTIPTVCADCATLKCYNSAWQVISCPSGASWTERNTVFSQLGVSNTSGHQWKFSARTALRYSFTVDSATSYSKRGKMYVKGPSWAECSVYVPVCNCGCPPCPSKCYKPNPNVCGCNNCTDCFNYQYEVSPCNGTQNRVCRNCTVCLAGEYQVRPCNATSDRTCRDCTVCTAGQYRRAPCTATSDTTCSNCTVCLAGQYRQAPCNATSDTTCRNCSVCLAGQYRQAACNATSDTTCRNCSVCLAGQYRLAACNATSDTTCRNCSVCLAGQYRLAACNATSDTTCRNCSVCLAGQYRQAACNATSDTTCRNCTVCRNGQYQQAPCNATSDTTCRNCSVCLAGQYQVAPCNVTSDTTCSNCSVCLAGQYQVAPCNATSDTTCTNCTECEDGFFQDVPCNSTFPGTCQQCSNCSANEQVQFPCNATHDTVCVPCPECANCTDPNSHLSNNGLNCTCNEGFAESGEGVCEPVPCCQDCHACGFNASQACYLHDATTCDYSCYLNDSDQCTATTPFDAGYTIEFTEFTQDTTCCSDQGSGCSCFRYDLGAGGSFELDDFHLVLDCAELQLCDGFVDPPCLEGVTRFDPSNDPPTVIPFFIENDNITNLRGITVTDLNLAGAATQLTFIFQGNLTESSLPVTFTASAYGADTTTRACLISSLDGPNCLTC